VPRRRPRIHQPQSLTTGRLPLLAVVGSLFVLGGSIGWLWSNPLQMSSLDEMALMRGSVNSILFASGGMLVPLVYTWFVTGRSEPLMSTRGLAAGVVAGLAAGPFVQPGIAFLIGVCAGATVPFVTYLVDRLLRLDDATGAITVSGLPAMVGLLLVGIFADGATGRGWQMTGVDSYLGIAGQGVSGLFTAQGYQMDFPGQVQAQIIGILALALWGFLVGMVLCVPLGLLLQGLLHTGEEAPHLTARPGEPGPAPVSQPTPDWRTMTFRPPDDLPRR
jgi:Amt family ammonium transporter